MKTPKISVIIPVYNAEKTIGNILEKLITQDYKNIELVIVNDGSKDGSLKLLRRFAKKDKRITVVDQKNGGVSVARNVGIDRATGEYITFIDSDDDISEDLISELARHIKPDSDFVMCGMMINGKVMTSPGAYVEGREAIVNYVLKSLLTKNLLYGPYCKLFRQSIVSDNKIIFPVGVNYGEDTIFVLNYIRKARNIRTYPDALYEYNFLPTGLALANSQSRAFRKERSIALNIFALTGISARNVVLYFALKMRWTMAFLKSHIRSKSV